MTSADVKKILEKQLQLLSEESERPIPARELADVSRAMLDIANYLVPQIS